MGGVARRAWARNENSIDTSIQYNKIREGSDHITIPYIADDQMIEKLVTQKFRDQE
jgi:urocanate hydratase